MKTQYFRVTTKFEMASEQVLSCVYEYTYFPGSNSEPPDVEMHEPTFFINNDIFDYELLPKGLNKIADEMLVAGPGEFNFKEKEIFRDYA